MLTPNPSISRHVTNKCRRSKQLFRTNHLKVDHFCLVTGMLLELLSFPSKYFKRNDYIKTDHLRLITEILELSTFCFSKGLSFLLVTSCKYKTSTHRNQIKGMKIALKNLSRCLFLTCLL